MIMYFVMTGAGVSENENSLAYIWFRILISSSTSLLQELTLVHNCLS